jgi:PIN domain nuclease of toxin-antitoxin system
LGGFELILLDTHVWVWWVMGDPRLTHQHRQWLEEYGSDSLGVSIFSCWEVAKLVENSRLDLPCSIEEWLNLALNYPGVRLINLTLPIVVQSTQLVRFHRDPADQIIVATAKVHNCCLLTADEKILAYPDVKILR